MKTTLVVFKELDTETGELIEHNSVEINRKTEEVFKTFNYIDWDDEEWCESFLTPPKGLRAFAIVYDILLKKLSELYSKLSKLEVFVLFYVILHMMFNQNSLICKQKQIAEDLGVFPSDVSAAFKTLQFYDFVCKAEYSASGYRFMVNPMYARKCTALKTPILQATYNKISGKNAEKKKGGDFSEKSPPNKNKSKNNKQTKNENSNSCNNIKESIKRSIKFGGGAKQLKIMEYLIENFKHGRILNKTVDEIAVETNCERKLVLKFLKLLEENKLIKRERGKIELSVTLKTLNTVVSGVL